MTAATNSTVTARRPGELIPVPLAAAAQVLEGTLCVIDSDGWAVDSADVGGADQICLGIWDESVSNQYGQNGDRVACVMRKNQWLLLNHATDAITQADLGATVYVADNQTLAKTDGGGTRSIAGTFMGFDIQDPNLVWVEI